jgi:hypothetical protein
MRVIDRNMPSTNAVCGACLSQGRRAEGLGTGRHEATPLIAKLVSNETRRDKSAGGSRRCCWQETAAAAGAAASLSDLELAETLALSRRLQHQVSRCSYACKAAPPRLQLDTRAPLLDTQAWPLSVAEGGVALLPALGSLRRDFDVETLVGAAGLSKILRPVDLAAATAPVKDMADAVRALRLCVNACTLLANQSGQIRNSYLLRLSLVQHLFLQVLPAPLPVGSDEAAAGRCFWRGRVPMKHETQVPRATCGA